MRNPRFDVLHMDYEEMKEELRRASKLLDVAPESLDAFGERGGKVLLVQGMTDQQNHRTRPVYEYPYYPAYNGTGDVNRAESFHPERCLEHRATGTM